MFSLKKFKDYLDKSIKDLEKEQAYNEQLHKDGKNPGWIPENKSTLPQVLGNWWGYEVLICQLSNIKKLIRRGEFNNEESSNEIYLIENTVDERAVRVSGYFKTYNDAYEALKECSDWFNVKGTGQIWKVSFGLHAKREQVYDSYTQGPAK